LTQRVAIKFIQFAQHFSCEMEVFIGMSAYSASVPVCLPLCVARQAVKISGHTED